MSRMWPFTVPRPMCSVSAISALAWPSAIKRRISVSRGVSGDERAPSFAVSRNARARRARSCGSKYAPPSRAIRTASTMRSGSDVLQAVRVGAGGERREHFFFEIDHRHDHYARLRQLATHALRQCDTVDARQTDIDDRDVGALALDRFQAGQAIGRFADDVERRFERRSQAGARQRVVFDDDDARFVAPYCSLRRQRYGKGASARFARRIFDRSPVLFDDPPHDVEAEPVPAPGRAPPKRWKSMPRRSGGTPNRRLRSRDAPRRPRGARARYVSACGRRFDRVGDQIDEGAPDFVGIAHRPTAARLRLRASAHVFASATGRNSSTTRTSSASRATGSRRFDSSPAS